MTKKNLTLKQLAEELDVSKSYIDKIVRTLGMHTELKKEGNKYVVNSDQKLKIKAFLDSKKTHTEPHTNMHNGTHTSMHTESEVSFLREQLIERNKEIENLHKILDQQQQLQLITQNLLENQKLALSNENEEIKNDNIDEFIKEQEKQLSEFQQALNLKSNENEELKRKLKELEGITKKGFWKRLFNR